MDFDLAAKKAELILADAVYVPDDVIIPVRISKSTAGPGAGSESIVLGFSGMRVKKAISRNEREFSLKNDGESLAIMRKGKPYIKNVTIVPVGYHCPEQAFFNLDQRCIYKCIYCASPMLGDSTYKGQDKDVIVQKIRDSYVAIESVAFTSGVIGSVQNTIDRICECARAVKEAFSDMPVGAEPYVESKEQVDQLYASGITEIKINCETVNKELFNKACPGLDYDNIFRMLEYSVEVFGKGNVTSNIIIGLGESDDDVINIMERLASIGVIPGLRPLKSSGIVKENIRRVLGDTETLSSERIIRLAKSQKHILEKYSLGTDMKTMCLRCTCCDIVPFKDI